MGLNIFKKMRIKLNLIVLNYKKSIIASKFRKRHNIILPKYYFFENDVRFKAFTTKQITIKNNIDLGIHSSIININSCGKINLGENFRMRHFCSIRNEGGDIEIGDYVFFNNNCSINCFDSIKIGNKVMFGEGVKIYDHNHKYEYLNQELCIHPDDYTKKPIIINDNCWIGSNVVILKGVTIGHNSIIGAGCVIFKSVPPNSIIVNKQDLEIKQIR